ncbi:Domain of uncharacterised function DUF1828 [Megamonas hypermegale]|uniref:Domain of uncharacterized function DUF1828 n=1 Tax=Megamonas hypermegale TaxID=158847 RepID=A0A378NS63_9FIRM|nr:DUF1828 domain-containing protein [Megamonas hypermegale]STY71230.1 Domain of uncharacterised function DUF1828 [Megamonas hypermegale]
MNMINIICKYQEWLTDNLTIKLISNNKKEQVYSIVTPCMNMDNDFIEIYIKVLNFNRIVITDDKNSISRLTMQGLNDENKMLLLKKIVASNDFYVTNDFCIEKEIDYSDKEMLGYYIQKLVSIMLQAESLLLI